MIYMHFTHNHLIHSFHNQLKTVHLNGKVNRRVDFLVHHREGCFIRVLDNCHLQQIKERRKNKVVTNMDFRYPTNMKVMYMAHVHVPVTNLLVNQAARKCGRMDCG